ncbi:MAG: hypothetical protein FJZ01_08285 [Candidatus Sericytochromatia bacterium]|nr:hypothetical protein [Candidatus Tanganyikabacteria bacterium]
MGSSWSAVAAWVNAAANVAPPPAPRARRAAVTRPFREVATRSLARAVTEPLPVFIPEGAIELAAWLALPRDRQALLSAIASRLDAEGQSHLREILARGILGDRDLAGHGELLSHLAALVTGPATTDWDQAALLDALLRGIAHPDCVRGPLWVVLLARRSPAELARLVGGLAGPHGGVTAVSGRWLSRYPNWFAGPGDLISRLLGSACLQIDAFARVRP